MAGGRGPAPKDPAKRARRNKELIPARPVFLTPLAKPELPSFSITIANDGMISTQEFTWPEATVLWWQMLDSHPLVAEFGGSDWSYLMDTARIHAAFWLGNITLAGELRLREAKYGFTPEDRLRLRWQVATTAGAEADAVSKTVRASTARERYGNARAVRETPAPKPRAVRAKATAEKAVPVRKPPIVRAKTPVAKTPVVPKPRAVRKPTPRAKTPIVRKPRAPRTPPVRRDEE